MNGRPPSGAPRRYDFPDFTRQRLGNGMGVWLVPLPDRELVSVQLLTDAGAASEEEAQAGVAALTARALVTGTQRLDAGAFAEAAEAHGIDVSSESSWDTARAGFTALGEHLGAGLQLLAEMVTAPRLDAGEIERLKSERLNDILQGRSDPARLADEAFLRQVYAESVPYGRLSAGTADTVEALDPDAVREFHAGRSGPDVADLVVAGAFEPDDALGLVENAFGNWHGTAPGHRPIDAEPRGGRRVVLVDRPGSVQSELRVGLVGIARDDPRFFSALVLGALLGGTFRSRLNTRLREELGYTYGARSSFDPRRSAGPFTASTAVQTEVTVDAIRELLAQLDRIREEPPPDGELREVRDYLVGVFPLRFETTGGIAAAIEPLAVYDLPQTWWQTYRQRLEAVGPSDVLDAARELIRPEELVILVTGDAARLRDDLGAAAFGPVETVAL